MNLKSGPVDIEMYKADSESSKVQRRNPFSVKASESSELLSQKRTRLGRSASNAAMISRKMTRKLSLTGDDKDSIWSLDEYGYLQGFVEQIIPVVFATSLNLIEVVAFGAIFLPSNLYGDVNVVGIFTQLLIISTVTSQLSFVLMSKFQSVVGTEMADNIPFFHTVAAGIATSLSNLPNGSAMMLPTTLVAIALSTILNGAIFIALGHFKVGSTLSAFPRYVILGMILGFGVFVSITIVQLSTGDALSFDTFSALDSDGWIQLGVVVLAEAALRGVIYLGFSEIFVSLILLAIPPFFYLCLYLSGETIAVAQQHMWLFAPENAVQWNQTWDYFQFENVSWLAVFQNLPTILCLGMYSALVLPMRIPSLALTTGEDHIDFDAELIAMGTGNLFAGLLGSPQNLLAYGNSVMYLDLKGKGKISQLSVALLTFGLFFVGPNLIAYLPRLIASLIMLHLGVDLITNSLVKSSKSLTDNEYITMIILGVIVSIFGFVVGMAAGVFLACMTVVVESAKISLINKVFSERVHTRSSTKWPYSDEDILNDATELGHLNIKVVQLQGHLLFTNSGKLVRDLRDIILPIGVFSFMDDSQPNSEKDNGSLRYLVLDCNFITGADINAVGELAKLKRQLKSVNILFAGVSQDLMPKFRLEITDKSGKLNVAKNTNRIIDSFYGSVDAALYAIEENALERLSAMDSFSSESNSDKFVEMNDYVDGAVRGAYSGEDLSQSSTKRDRDQILKKIFEALINQGNPNERERRKISVFANDAAFKRLGMLFLKNVVICSNGDTLWEDGEVATSMGLLLSGELESIHNSGGRSYMKPGAMFGIMGLMCLQNHHHTVKATKTSQVAYLSIHDWDDIQLNDTEVLCELQRILILYLSSKKDELRLFDAGKGKK